MFLPDYQSVGDDGVRSAFRALECNNIAPEKGLTVTEIMDAIHDDEISSMYILGENPAMSDPDVMHARKRSPNLIIWLFRIFSSLNSLLCGCYLPPRPGLKNRHCDKHKPASSNGSASHITTRSGREDWWITVNAGQTAT